MYYAFEINAADVLGVPSDANLQQIQAAYRARVKKHHPDAGGEEWAFRAVARAYELLSHARVRARIGFEPPPAPPAPQPSARPQPSDFFDDEPDDSSAAEPSRPGRAQAEGMSGFFRAGVSDAVTDPGRLVDVEMFTIRYEIDSPLSLIGGPENRNLSSCLNITWPAPPAHEGDPEIPANPDSLKRLKKVFDGMPRRSKATSYWSQTKDGRFVGWLSYPTANRAYEAFEIFHRVLNDKGLGVRQSSRELFIARGQR
jgi:curved DNA-binding protein CbpA